MINTSGSPKRPSSRTEEQSEDSGQVMDSAPDRPRRGKLVQVKSGTLSLFGFLVASVGLLAILFYVIGLPDESRQSRAIYGSTKAHIWLIESVEFLADVLLALAGTLGVIWIAILWTWFRGRGKSSLTKGSQDELVTVLGDSPERVTTVPPWSGLVIDDVYSRRAITDVVLRNASEKTWTARGKSIEDANGNRSLLPQTLSLAPDESEILRFNRQDGEIFETAESEMVTIHTDSGKQTVLWQHPGVETPVPRS